MKPPIRMRDDRSVPLDMAADLQAYTRAPHQYDSAAGWEALQQTLANAAPQPTEAELEALVKLQSTTGQARRFKLIALGSAVSLAGVGWLAAERYAAEPSTRAPVVERAPAPAEPAPAPPVEAQPQLPDAPQQRTVTAPI